MCEETNSGLTPYRWVECGRNFKRGCRDLCVLNTIDGLKFGWVVQDEYDEYIFHSDEGEACEYDHYLLQFLAEEDQRVFSWAYCEIEKPDY